MKDLNKTSFTDRLKAGTRARAQQLERARAKALASQAGAAERAQIRSALAGRREERAAAKAAAAIKLKSQQVAEEAALALAEQKAAAEQEREIECAAGRAEALKAQQKATRDARYAARKSRTRRQRGVR